LQENKRLPVIGSEFWCRSCGKLKILTEMVPPDFGGRRRFQCTRCRRLVVLEAGRRQYARKVAARRRAVAG